MTKVARKGVEAPATLAPEADGRRRRSQDSRARIVAAMLELVRAGAVTPGAERVAAKADVGLRTVFRHFKDMDSLYGEMSKAVEGQLQEVFDRPFAVGDRRERILELVQRRAEVYETIAPFKRASDAHRHRSRFLEAGHARLVARSREALRHQLPVERAEDEPMFEALDLLLSFEAWNRLRREQGLPVAKARQVLETAACRLIA